jgi:hypothetical protein
MNDRVAYDEDCAWLDSDGQIIGKVRKSPHAQGVELRLEVPWGEDVVAVAEKLNADSMSAFCQMARESYNEQKAEQEAQAYRKANERARGSSGTVQEAIPTSKEAVAIDFMDREAVAARIRACTIRLAALTTESEELEREGAKLVKILEVLDAFENDAEELRSVSLHEEEGESKGMDKIPRSVEIQLERASDFVSDGEDS